MAKSRLDSLEIMIGLAVLATSALVVFCFCLLRKLSSKPAAAIDYTVADRPLDKNPPPTFLQSVVDNAESYRLEM